MNSDLQEKNGRSEKSWRYVHQEMDEPERREFERLMGADEALRREVAHIRKIHGNLRELMPLTEQPEEALADQILREWERSTIYSSSNSNLRKKVWAAFWEGARNLFDARPWHLYGLRSLAMAAVTVVLIVGVRAYLAGPLEWLRPEISMGVQYRGEGPEKAPGYSRGDILEAHGALRRSVEKYYADMKGAEPPTSWRGRGRKWRLAAKYQELPDGGTQVQVALYSSRHRKPVKEWSNYYPDLRSLGTQVDEIGEQIVKELIKNESEKH